MNYTNKSRAIRCKAPKLADWQKAQLVALMDKYFQMRKTLFYYTGSARRENYAFENAADSLGYGSDLNNACMYIDSQGRYRYLINCGVFCQFVWMGRKVEDFISGGTAGETALKAYLDGNSEAPVENMLTEQPTITRNITTSLEENGKKWGYYFDFELSRKCFKAARQTDEAIPDEERTYFAYNSFYQPDLEAERQTKYPDLRVPLGFDGASAMAEELFRKGYEVHFDEMDVGDMVFFTSDVSDDYRNPPDAEDDDPMTGKVFRRITHVGLVYGFSDNGRPIIMDSSDAYEGVLSMGRTSMNIEYNEDGTPKTDNFGLCKTANLLNNIVMVARHPAAFGDKKPMPENFGFYRGIDVPGLQKNYTEKTGPFDGEL